MSDPIDLRDCLSVRWYEGKDRQKSRADECCSKRLKCVSHWEGSLACVAGASTTLLDGAAALEIGHDAGGSERVAAAHLHPPAPCMARPLDRPEHSGENLALVLTSA